MLFLYLGWHTLCSSLDRARVRGRVIVRMEEIACSAMTKVSIFLPCLIGIRPRKILDVAGTGRYCRKERCRLCGVAPLPILVGDSKMPWLDFQTDPITSIAPLRNVLLVLFLRMLSPQCSVSHSSISLSTRYRDCYQLGIT